MATFHYNMKAGSLEMGGAREHGRYIRRDARVRTKEVHDVSSFSVNLPLWAAADPDKFWATADAMERKNAAVYREHEIALPIELTRQQNETLAREFVDREFPNFVVEVGIHWKNGNPHLHAQVCERELDGIERNQHTFFKRYNAKDPLKGGGKKSTRFSGGELKDRVRQQLNVMAIRESWAQLANAHLAMHGQSARIDHRSNEARGINVPAGVHLGRKAAGLEKRGIVSRRRAHALVLEERRQYVISARLGEIAERDRRAYQRELNQRDQLGNKNGADPILKVVIQRTESKRSSTPPGFSHVEKLGNRGVNWVDVVPHCVGLARVHQAGFDHPAYFSSDRPRGSPPIAIQKSNGFIAVPDIKKLSDAEVNLIILLAAHGGNAIEAIGSQEWCERVEIRAKVLGINVSHDYQVSDAELEEFNRRQEDRQREDMSLQNANSNQPSYRPKGI